MNELLSIKFLADLLPELSSLVMTLSILIPLSSLGSRLTIFAYDNTSRLALPLLIPHTIDQSRASRKTYKSRQQAIDSKGPPLPLIIRPQHNGDILDTNHKRQGPDNQGQSAEKVIVARLRAEG